MAILKFKASWTVEQFKEEFKAPYVEVRKSKEKGTLFFIFGPGNNHSGFVSKKGLPTNPVISLCEDEEGNELYLLHEQGSGERKSELVKSL